MQGWNKQTRPMPDRVKNRISATLKAKGIKPPSNKGRHFTAQHIRKIIEAKRQNGSLYHTPDRTIKIQKARKLFYDRVGRRSELVDRIKNTKKYRTWRRSVFVRDGYKCVKCNRVGGKIQADHIVQKAIFIKICNYNYDQCMGYKPLWDIENGRTLCHTCHKATETYGKLI